jgi:hypothetical protein
MSNQKLTIIARILAKPESKELVKSELLKLIDITRAEKEMKRFVLAMMVVLTSINIQAQSNKVAETVFSSDVVRAGNMAITKSGRMFVTINPLMGSEVKVYEVF